MKKKIGDLTLREVTDICRKRGYMNCRNCSLFKLCDRTLNYKDEDLNQEIEVDE